MAHYDTPGLTYDSGLRFDLPDLLQPPKKRMAQVSLNLSRLNIAALLQTANNIKTSLTGNATFPQPTSPTLLIITGLITALETANDNYELSVLTAKENLTLRDDAAAALIAGLTALAGHVQSVSGGDPAKIQSAGMSIKSARTPATIPDMVGNLSVYSGDSAGELDLRWDPIPGAASYEVQVCHDPVTPAGWVQQPSVTKAKTEVHDLTSGAKVWARVRAVNAAGVGGWSSEISKIVP